MAGRTGRKVVMMRDETTLIVIFTITLAIVVAVVKVLT
jgi:hypothetical protein